MCEEVRYDTKLVGIATYLEESEQEGLAVVSLVRDDPSIGGGHFCWGSYDGFNFAGWCIHCVPSMHRNPMHFCDRKTDGQTRTDIVA